MEISKEIVAAADKVGRSEVGLDTCAGASIFSSREYLSRVHDSKDNLIINGIHKEGCSLTCDQEGDSVFGPVYYNPDATINVLSYALMKDHCYKVWQDAKDDIFCVQHQKNGDTYLFRRKHGIYIHNMASDLDIVHNKHVHVTSAMMTNMTRGRGRQRSGIVDNDDDDDETNTYQDTYQLHRQIANNFFRHKHRTDRNANRVVQLERIPESIAEHPDTNLLEAHANKAGYEIGEDADTESDIKFVEEEEHDVIANAAGLGDTDSDDVTAASDYLEDTVKVYCGIRDGISFHVDDSSYILEKEAMRHIVKYTYGLIRKKRLKQLDVDHDNARSECSEFGTEFIRDYMSIEGLERITDDNNLFRAHETYELVGAEKTRSIHSCSDKLLRLCKSSRPDMSTLDTFLTSRVGVRDRPDNFLDQTSTIRAALTNGAT